MELYSNNYYHLYNRSNNAEVIFKSRENYLCFLNKYRHCLAEFLDTIGYCLMPTHFHFLVFVKSEEIRAVKKGVGVWLSSYTRAMNKRFERHGSLFQQHTRAKHVDDESYLITLLTYIHQNPVRRQLVRNIEEWEFSSYPDYIQKRRGTLVRSEMMKTLIPSIDELRRCSESMIQGVRREYWV